MIKELHIENFLLIEHLHLHFNAGFTTITGETGAGKSILLGALKLLMGERSETNYHRNPDQKVILEAVFDTQHHPKIQEFFKAHDLDYEPNTIVLREITPQGKSRSFINDTPVSLQILKLFSEQFIDIHSQFDTSQIKKNHYFIELLDTFGNDAHREMVIQYKSLFNDWQNTLKKLESAQDQQNQFKSQEDYKRFQWEELQQANLKVDELEALENESLLLSHADDILLGIQETIQLLGQESMGVLDQLYQANRLINKSAEKTTLVSSIQERLTAVHLELNDIQKELTQIPESIEHNPIRLEQVNERIRMIKHLFQKHHVQSIGDLLSIESDLSELFGQTTNWDDQIQNLINTTRGQFESLTQMAKSMNDNRLSSSKIIAQQLETQLTKLGISNAHLEFEITDLNELNLWGGQSIHLLFSANKGIQAQAIDKSASGGELSRIMLCIKQLLASKTTLPTLILDEIDTGVSGKIAYEMGGMMHQMSLDIQLISITHLPQIAATANHHFKVYKDDAQEKTQSKIIPLNMDERVEEIAKMISGASLSDEAIQQAKHLLQLN